MSQTTSARRQLLWEVLSSRQGAFFDYHDSTPVELKQRYGSENISLELTRSGYYLVETPAVYVQQKDPEISINAEGEQTLNRYFTRRSDVTLSREAKLLSTEMVDTLANQIIEIVARRDKLLEK